jgi:hypothetical protein
VNENYSTYIRRQHCICCGKKPAISRQVNVPELAGEGRNEGSRSYCIIPICLECQDSMILKSFLETQRDIIVGLIIAYLSQFIKDKQKLFETLSLMASFEEKITSTNFNSTLQ